MSKVADNRLYSRSETRCRVFVNPFLSLRTGRLSREALPLPSARGQQPRQPSTGRTCSPLRVSTRGFGDCPGLGTQCLQIKPKRESKLGTETFSRERYYTPGPEPEQVRHSVQSVCHLQAKRRPERIDKEHAPPRTSWPRMTSHAFSGRRFPSAVHPSSIRFALPSGPSTQHPENGRS